MPQLFYYIITYAESLFEEVIVDIFGDSQRRVMILICCYLY